MTAPRRLVVAGNGMVTATLLEELVARHADLDITVFGDEPHPAYDRIRLSTLLAGGCEQSQLTLLDRTWYRRHRILLRDGVRVTGIDTTCRVVATSDGDTTPYDDLVIAVGSEPLVPDIPGRERSGVHTFRTIADVEAMLAVAAPGRRAVVVGGGLLGLEAAYGLRQRGAEVRVVHLVDRLMERQLDTTGARVLQGELSAMGMKVVLPAETVAIEGNGHVEGLRLRDGRAFDADLVVIACGIRPSTALARDAGIATRRGIVVDDALRTSAAGVHAVGECTEHSGTTYGLVAPLRVQARVLAARLRGDDTARFEGAVPATTLKVAGVRVFSAGAVDEEVPDEVLSLEDSGLGVYKRVLIREGRVRGAVLVGDLSTAPRITSLIGDGVAVGGERLSLVAAPSGAAPGSEVHDLADDATVCGCNGVSKRTVLDAVVQRGCTTRQQVTRCTRAGGSCGSCAPLIDALLAADGDATGAQTRHKAGSAEPTLCECIPITRRALREAVIERDLRSVSATLRALGDGTGCARCKPALAYHLDVIRCGDWDEERSARFVNDRVHANIQRDGTFSVVPRMFGGITSPAELRRIADVAERFDVPMVKVTGGQRLDLLGVRKQDLPAIWDQLGMPSGHAYAKAVRTVKTCVGMEFCRYGVGDSTSLGVALEKAMWGLYTPHKVKSGVTGCPRNCAEVTVKDIGIMAIATGWEVHVGGAAGMRVRKADRLCTVSTADEALRASLLFLQHYREEAEYLERAYHYVERAGIEAVRAATVDAPDDAQQALLDRFALSRSRVSDPWLEGQAPRTPLQFAQPEPLDPELDLPGLAAGTTPAAPMLPR
jgi:nitrite reductase (NADH) large subunit